jgi:signal transduction histidine kinase
VADAVVANAFVPPIVLTDLRLFGRPVTLSPGSPLKKAVNYTDTITLSRSQNIFSIGFSALSYFNAATNRYRYMLEGLDKKWNEVGSDQRLASYTTLPTGTYIFHVQGASRRGPWSEPGAQLRIQILPPWWATRWFWITCLVLILLLLWSVHRYHLHQLTIQFNVRLEERVNERTRIARELHDTMLQSFQGLLLRFQATAHMLPGRPGEALKTLESAIDQAAQAITEGRDAVEGLRSSTVVSNDLSKAINTLGKELASGETNPNGAEFYVEVEGTSRDLRPIVRDEVYRIAGEAVRNAFKHAHAQKIEVEIRYDDRQLRLRVRDDGKGIDPKVLSKDGQPGHYGLRGMRERAKLMGGKLAVWSELDSGTELELSIPASRAYETSVRRRSWLVEKLAGKDTEAKS